MSNVGSVFRSADAFAIEAIYLCGLTPRPPHRDIHKTALGATETVQWKYFPQTLDAIQELIAEGYDIVSVEQTHDSLSLEQFTPDLSRKTALVFGHEVFGVEEEIIQKSYQVLEIPQAGTKHSLNIAVSAGIVLWKFAEAHFKKTS
jgi:tRNA G18 (ribose-2'-O)-methylase SpoU